MFETHYARQRPKPRYAEDKGELLTQLESVLYNLLPTDKLLCKDDILKLYKSKERYRPDGLLNEAIEGLIKKGYLKEIIGVRLERLISSF
jgi:hypothetical protein